MAVSYITPLNDAWTGEYKLWGLDTGTADSTTATLWTPIHDWENPNSSAINYTTYKYSNYCTSPTNYITTEITEDYVRSLKEVIGTQKTAFRQEYDANFNTWPTYPITELGSTPHDEAANNIYTTCANNDAFRITNFGQYYVYSRPTEKQLKLLKLKSNLVISVKSHCQPVRAISPEEQCALDTLHEMISEFDFRRYLRNGYITVRGESGDLYQIFKGQSHQKTKIWRRGKLIEEVCVYLKGNPPPTDQVIAFKTIIETSEEQFLSLGNRFKFQEPLAIAA